MSAYSKLLERRTELATDIETYKAGKLTSAQLADKYDVSSSHVMRRLIARFLSEGAYLDAPTIDYPPRLQNERNPHPEPFALRGAVVDIETTDFSAVGYKGTLVCVSILDTDPAINEVVTYSVRFEDQDDYRLVCEVSEALSKYQFLIGHFYSGFDRNWLQTRLMGHRARPVSPFAHWIGDTFQWAKTLGMKSYKGLAELCDFYGLPYVKTSVNTTSWHNIRSRVRYEFDNALDEIVHHCEEDVKANRLLFWHMYEAASRQQGAWKKDRVW